MAAEWIDWAGGECPVPDDTYVDVRFRNDTESLYVPAHSWEWGVESLLPEDYDIIAYRVSE